jgi:NADPH:quinone reductase
LLVVGATSGVGMIAVQAGKYLEAKVIGVSRSAEKLEKLKKLGMDLGIRAAGGGFADRVLEATEGKGVNLAINLVGGTAFPDCIRSLANQGRLAIIGYVDHTMKAEIDLEAVHGRRLHIFGVSNALMSEPQRVEAMRGFVRDWLPGFADGRITPVVDKVFPFGELPAAKAYVETDAQLGKVVVRMP